MLRRTLFRLAAEGPKPPPTYGESVRFSPHAVRSGKQHVDSATNRFVRREVLSDKKKTRSKVRGQELFSAVAAVQHAIDTNTDARTLRVAQLTNQIFAKGISFITSACNISFVPDGNPATPEIAFVGRAHVGKTALLRSVFKDRYAIGHSNTQKRKDAMSFFNVGNVFNVVECPGYGSRSCPLHLVLQHAALIRNFVRYRPSLKMLYYCLDISTTKGLCTQDLDILQFLSKECPNFTIVITKGDQLVTDDHKGKIDAVRGQIRLSAHDIEKELQLHGIHHPMIVTSAYKMGGLDTLRFDIVSNALHALPTEMLTYTEACRLSKRLLSQQEIASVKPLSLTPTELDDEQKLWNRELAAEKLLEKESTNSSTNEEPEVRQNTLGQAATPNGPAPGSREVASLQPSEEYFDDEIDDGMVDVTGTSEQVLSEEERVSLELEVDEALDFSEDSENIISGVVKVDAAVGIVRHDEIELAAQKAEYIDAKDDQRRNFRSLTHKLENKDHLAFIRSTSPWRNPLHWPANVVPTRSLRHNIMRCPEDSSNPYLTQPRFVAPRMDMYFRRPSSLYIRARSSDKGLYHADGSLAKLDRPYTIPFFPTIQDVDITPKPQHFVGISKYFAADGEGRLEGLLALKQLNDERINPLGATDQISDPALRAEVAKIEAHRYRAAAASPTLPSGNQSPQKTPTIAQPTRIAFLTPNS